MVFVVRDFNSSRSDIGNISIFLSENKKISITILNLHGMGQALIDVTYLSVLDFYDMYLSIFDKITRDVYQEKIEKDKLKGSYLPEENVFSIIPEYKDILCFDDDDDEKTENVYYSDYFGNYITFTRESVKLLEEEEYDMDFNDDEFVNDYIIHGEILENGEFIYDKPIRSNSYKG